MSRIAYVNGQYVNMADAAVHIEDRGYQFADGVYEVIAVVEGNQVDAAPHLDRLDRSLSELSIDPPMTRAAMSNVILEVIRRNRVRNGIVYLQVTRGVARRDHPFPKDARPALVITARSQRLAHAAAEKGVKVITVPESRWARCDIKSVSLLPNILAKQEAREADAYEAWFVEEDGMVTEGSSSNAWIIDADGNLVTRQLSNSILPGITRAAVQRLAEEAQIKIVERSFSVDEAKTAAEAFVTSATSLVTPVVNIDGELLNGGKAGPLGLRLRELYAEYMVNPGDHAEVS